MVWFVWVAAVAILFNVYNSNLLDFIIQGPSFPEPLLTPEDIEKLNAKVDVQKELGYVYKAITLTRHKIEGKVPLLGFSGAPVSMSQRDNHLIRFGETT